MTYHSDIRLLNSEESAFKALLRNYKSNAYKRDFRFELSEEQFGKLTKMNCHWCGLKPMQLKVSSSRYGLEKALSLGYIPYVYNGIDRLSNSTGYVEFNCVPCCYQCNWAKRDLTTEEFQVWLDRIGNYRE